MPYSHQWVEYKVPMTTSPLYGSTSIMEQESQDLFCSFSIKDSIIPFCLAVQLQQAGKIVPSVLHPYPYVFYNMVVGGKGRGFESPQTEENPKTTSLSPISARGKQHHHGQQ